MEKVLNCMVIDDDKEVNTYVCDMVSQTSFLRLAGSYSNASDALPELERGVVDLLLLDINLPGIDGVTFAATLKSSHGHDAPRVVLISGSRDYALDGYKVDAVDYLLKPFSYEDFYKAVIKARSLLINSSFSATDDYLFLKVEHDLVRVSVKEIAYLESCKDYVNVVIGDKTIKALSTLKALEEKLTGRRFMRVHRSFIINLDKIESIQHLTVRFGKVIIPVTEQYRERFRAEFRNWL